MKQQEFDKQYDTALRAGKFAQAVNSFVVDDKTALSALQSLHERIQQLISPDSCPRHLYFLGEDLCDLLVETDKNYRTGGDITERGDFKNEDESRA